MWKKGHLARVCRNKTPYKKEQRPQHKSNSCFAIHVLTEDSWDYSMYNVTGSPVQPLKVTVIVNGTNLEMGVDTGASASIISEQTYNQLWPQDQRPKLQPTAVKLRTYSGEQLTVKGVVSVAVQYNGQSESLSLIVANGRGPSLLGRDWLTKIRLDWTHLCNNHVCYSLSLQGILADYSTVFDTEQILDYKQITAPSTFFIKGL